MSNITNGTFAFVYGGPKGVGAGYLVIRDGSFHAKDVAGVQMQGSISLDASGNRLVIRGKTHIPPGVWLVAGSSTHDLPITRDLDTTLPTSFANGDPFEWVNASGPTTAMAFQVDDTYPSRFEKAAAILNGE